MDNSGTDVKLRTHPTCQVKGCDGLKAGAVQVAAKIRARPEDGGTHEFDGPIEIGVCLKHLRELSEGREYTISMEGLSKPDFKPSQLSVDLLGEEK